MTIIIILFSSRLLIRETPKLGPWRLAALLEDIVSSCATAKREADTPARNSQTDSRSPFGSACGARKSKCITKVKSRLVLQSSRDETHGIIIIAVADYHFASRPRICNTNISVFSHTPNCEAQKAHTETGDAGLGIHVYEYV